MRHVLRTIAISTLIALIGGCAVGPREYDGEGLGTVDGAYYDSPRPFDYDTYPAYNDGGYYYDGGFYGAGFYGGGYHGGGRYWRGDDRYHDHGWHDGHHDDHGGDHDGDHGHGDDRGGGDSGPRSPGAPTYNDMRAGKLNPHIHENVGGNRSSNSGHSGGGGKH